MYKRQIYNSAEYAGKKSECEVLEDLSENNFADNNCRKADCDSASAHVYIRKALIPVSYTHLDVYKRQRFIRLWNALNSLPEIQGRRIDAHIILGKSIKEIAEAEGVHCLLYTSRCV